MAREDQYHDRSVLIHGKFRSEKWDFQDHTLPPITTAVTFRLRSAERGAEGFAQIGDPDLDRANTPPIYLYDRFTEPCQGLLEETLAFAEKGESAVCFATGMAAVAAVLGVCLESGDHIVFHPAIYGCTFSQIADSLVRYGITHTSVDFNDLDALEAAIRPETKVVYFESPCNPTMELIDIEAVVGLVKRINSSRSEDDSVKTVIDNTFASPFAQRPITMGVDFVLHSLTKHISGFGATMGGVVIGPRTWEFALHTYKKNFGGTLSPDAAWHILTYGVPTLSLRLERQQIIAQEVAEYLEAHPLVEKVLYPGLESFAQSELALKQMRDNDGNFAPGAMIWFVMEGDPDQAFQRAKDISNHIAENALSITLAVSLGQIRTLIEHPSSMTHAGIPPEELVKAGIEPGGIRLSIGIEDVRDIISDLGKAMDSVS